MLKIIKTGFSNKLDIANNPRHPLAAHTPTVSCFYGVNQAIRQSLLADEYFFHLGFPILLHLAPINLAILLVLFEEVSNRADN